MNDRTSPPSAGTRTFAVWIGVTAIALFLLLGLLNYFLNPLRFRESALRGVAEILNRGENLALDDPNIDFRGLRSAALETHGGCFLESGGNRQF